MKRIQGFGLAISLAALLAAPIAFAQTPEPPGTKVTNADKNSDINKQVGLIDLYLTDAINNAKFLTTLGDASAGSNDKAIVAEARKNLDVAIDKTLTHVEKLRAWKSDLAMAAGSSGAPAASGTPAPAGGPNVGSIDELERQLKNAKIANKKLATAQLADVSGAIDGVATHLMGADNAFRSIAKWTNYIRLSSTNLSTVPVRGDELPATGRAHRDLDPGAATPSPGPHDGATSPGIRSTSPGMTAPGATPPDMAPGVRPGNANPSSREPVQPAPGASSPATAQPVK